jgi:hypothetical protein
MSKLDVSIPHVLPKEEALTRIKGLLADLQEEQKDKIRGVKEDWAGNTGNFSFNAKGFDVSGRITVEDDHVNVQGDLPFMLSFFKDTIGNVIRDKAGALLAK